MRKFDNYAIVTSHFFPRSLFLREKSRLGIPRDDLPFLKTWDLRAKNTRLPNDDHTHYWCQIFKAPDLEHKHHMIGVRFQAMGVNLIKL